MIRIKQQKNIYPVKLRHSRTRSAGFNTEGEDGGYIALMSAIIISIMLLALVFSVSSNEFYLRFDELNGEFKRQSLALAESCVNSAFVKIAQNFSYTPPLVGEAVPVGSDSCAIKSISYDAEDQISHKKVATIKTRGQFRGAWTSLTVQATVSDPTFASLSSYLPDITISSWTETADGN